MLMIFVCPISFKVNMTAFSADITWTIAKVCILVSKDNTDACA